MTLTTWAKLVPWSRHFITNVILQGVVMGQATATIATHTRSLRGLSTDESVSRNDGYCEGNKAPGSFYVGQAVDCWSPKVKPPPSFYRCADPLCYKILDPAIDSKEAKLTSLALG